MPSSPPIRDRRPEGALLAGVCAWIALALSWNVWVLRALFVGFLVFKTVATLIAYALLSLALHLIGKHLPGTKDASDELVSPELSQRSERIAKLEQRFKELEDSD
jgi:phage shock protein PspC (stress-responsive transcriptional regulator)